MFSAREKVLFTIIGLTLIVVTLNLYFTFSNRQADQKVVQTNQQPSTPPTASTKTDLFSSQTATIRGKVLSVSDNKMSVENDKGAKGDLEIGKILLINSSNGIKVASTSADFKQINLNQSVTITLVLVGDKYLVSSVTY